MGATAQGAGGTPLALAVARVLADDGTAECRARIRSEGDEPLLSAAARIVPLEELAQCEIEAGASRVSWTTDLSGYEDTHLALITGEINGFGIAGVMDPRSGCSSVQLRL